MSATLKIGKSINSNLNISTTYPNRIRSIKFPTAPAKIKEYAINNHFYFPFSLNIKNKSVPTATAVIA